LTSLEDHAARKTFLVCSVPSYSLPGRVRLRDSLQFGFFPPLHLDPNLGFDEYVPWSQIRIQRI
jgi:hypothetical protein